MKETIERVEKRGEEVEDSNPARQSNVTPLYGTVLEDAPGSSKDRQSHQTYDVPVGPIIAFDSVPELVSSDASMSSRSRADSPGETKNESVSSVPQPAQNAAAVSLEGQDLVTSVTSSNAFPSSIGTKSDTAIPTNVSLGAGGVSAA